MVSAKDITGKRFEKAAFGYKPDDVDEFLREISSEFAQLKKDKEDADRKIEVLADKIREYRSDEDALKEALLGAQRQGHQVISEANANAEAILSDARAKAEALLHEAQRNADRINYESQLAHEKAVGDIQRSIETETAHLENIKNEVSKFKAQLLSLYKNHLDLITAMPEVEASPDEDTAEEEASYEEPAATEYTEPEAEQSYEEQPAEAPSEPEPVPEEAPAEPPKKSAFPFRTPHGGASDSRYGELKFGQNKQQ